MSSTNMTPLKILLGVLVVVGIAGAYFYPQFKPLTGASTAGSTFGDSKVALMAMAPATAAATTTSILNTDTTDRMIDSVRIACGSVGSSNTFTVGNPLASFTLKLATTSVANNGVQGNTNLVGTTITLATSTPDFVISSSTPSIAGNNFFSDRWLAGSYLTAVVNATNTAACTVGVSYIPT